MRGRLCDGVDVFGAEFGDSARDRQPADEGVTCWNIRSNLSRARTSCESREYIRRSVEIAEATGHPDLEKRRAELERIRRALQQQRRVRRRVGAFNRTPYAFAASPYREGRPRIARPFMGRTSHRKHAAALIADAIDRCEMRASGYSYGAADDIPAIWRVSSACSAKSANAVLNVLNSVMGIILEFDDRSATRRKRS